MYRIRKTKSFDAAHRLPQHHGKCANLHGHTYSVTAEVEGRWLSGKGPEEGMLVDYGRLSEAMDEQLRMLDHAMLNDRFPNTTSELMAYELYMAWAPVIRRLSSNRARLAAVMVSETPSSCAEYRP